MVGEIILTMLDLRVLMVSGYLYMAMLVTDLLPVLKMSK